MIILKNDSIENCFKLNFLQKTHWAHTSISAVSGARDAKDLPDSISVDYISKMTNLRNLVHGSVSTASQITRAMRPLLRVFTVQAVIAVILSDPVSGLQLLAFVSHWLPRLLLHCRIATSFRAIFLDRGRRPLRWQRTPIKGRPIYRPHHAHCWSAHP